MIDSKSDLLAINEQALILVVRSRATSLGLVEIEKPVYFPGADGKPLSTGTAERVQVERFDSAWLETIDRVELRQEVEAATLGVISRLDKLMPDDVAEPLRQLVYLEDDHKRVTPIVFHTDCPWTVEELGQLSYRFSDAGRNSTKFGAFQWLILHEGFRCKQVERFKKRAPTPTGYEIVVGAVGNK
jgi:hypothetical protein